MSGWEGQPGTPRVDFVLANGVVTTAGAPPNKRRLPQARTRNNLT